MRKCHIEIFRQLLDRALADDLLSEEEENTIEGTARVIALSRDDVVSVVKGFGNQLPIARMNAGRLVPLPACAILLKHGESAYAEFQSNLMKEVVRKEVRGTSSGYSFRVAKGVRYHTGQFRAHTVVLGTSLQVADAGTLTVTSHRTVFKGHRQTMDAPHAKLVGLNVFTDGIQSHVSNRQSAPLFKVGYGHFVAAAVNAAINALPG